MHKHKRVHTHPGTCIRHGRVCDRRRFAAPQTRTAALGRAAHMPTNTLRGDRAAPQGGRRDAADGSAGAGVALLLAPQPIQVASTAARPCLALPSGPSTGALAGLSRASLRRSKRTPSLRRARRGAACSDRRCSPTMRTTAAAVRSRSSTRTRAVRARVECTVCREQSALIDRCDWIVNRSV